ncbi:MAG: DUF2721 domain-containing protein [Gammaproteobacteria bacterium]
MDLFAAPTSGFEIGRVIQLAITPVFTVAAIAGILGVLSTRLARIIDRARDIEKRIPRARGEEQSQLLCVEAKSNWYRIRVINRAIQLSVSGALMICLVIVSLFVGQFTTINLSAFIAALFILAMLLVIGGLICLLIEIAHATRRMQLGIESDMDVNANEPPAS